MTDITIRNGAISLAASVFGDPDAVPVLFLHGITLSRDSWEETADRLKDRYRVWTLDFRGHGHSDRADSYLITDYVSDAEATLAEIGAPAVVVGHSLGGCVAGALAQSGNAQIRAVFLEDPPWYFGEQATYARSVFPAAFAAISARQAALQREAAPLSAYLAMVTHAPSPLGGIAADHLAPRHLLSAASGLQRQDPRCWMTNQGSIPAMLARLETDRPFRCPAKIIQADPRYGAALMDGDEIRLAVTNPHADIARFDGCGHRLHCAPAFQARFAAELDAFLALVLAAAGGEGLMTGSRGD